MGIPKQVMDAENDADREIDALDRAGKAGVKITLSANTSGKSPTNPSKPVPAAEEKAPSKSTEAPQGNPPAETSTGVLAKAATEPAEDVEQLRADAQKWRQRMSSTDGRLNKLNEEWGARVSELQKEIAGLKAQLEAREATALRDQSGNLSDEAKRNLRACLGDDYSDIELENFAKAARMVVGNPAKEVNDILAERDRQAAAAKAKDGREEFLKKLQSAYPEFVRMDAANDPRLIGFYKTSLGGVMRGKTYGDVAEEALQALDYPTFELVVLEFAKNVGVNLSQNGKTASEDAESQARPAARQPSRQDKQPRRVPRSEIAQFRKKAFANRAEDYYGLTSEQVEEQLRFYEEAEENDRVDEEL